MTGTTTLYTIGEFSRLSRLSVRMLRHYDAHGVLVPAAVDPWTGRRHYSPAQLRTAADIRSLRDIGLGVSAISALLPARGTPAWSRALVLQREVLTRELRAAQERLALIHHLIEGDTMSISVEIRTIPAMTVASLRGHVPTYADEGLLWQQMTPLLQARGIAPVGPCGVIEHDDEYTEHDVDLSVFVPVAPGTTAGDPLVVVELPERECVVATVEGPYAQITTAHERIGQLAAERGLVLRAGEGMAGKGFNLYLRTLDEVAPEELVTQVCVPIS